MGRSFLPKIYSSQSVPGATLEQRKISLAPNPPLFLPSVCTHNNTWEWKTSEWMQGGRGPNANTTHQIIHLNGYTIYIQVNVQLHVMEILVQQILQSSLGTTIMDHKVDHSYLASYMYFLALYMYSRCNLTCISMSLSILCTSVCIVSVQINSQVSKIS